MVVAPSLWATLAEEAARESAIWAGALRATGERDETPVFSPLGAGRFALGVETIYEGYLLHYGRPRLFAAPDADTAVLLGDYLYAHGLVRIAREDEVTAVGDLAELLSVCAHLRADRRAGDGAAWAAAVAGLGGERRFDGAAGEPSWHASAEAIAGAEAVMAARARHDARVPSP